MYVTRLCVITVSSIIVYSLRYFTISVISSNYIYAKMAMPDSKRYQLLWFKNKCWSVSKLIIYNFGYSDFLQKWLAHFNEISQFNTFKPRKRQYLQHYWPKRSIKGSLRCESDFALFRGESLEITLIVPLLACSLSSILCISSSGRPNK